MAAAPQLKLIDSATMAFSAVWDVGGDPVRRVFEHWVLMSGRSIARCKLGPPRRAAINAALAMGYDEETLLLAVEGMAADPLDDCRSEQIRAAMRELEWLLQREARIERWAEAGERLRDQAERERLQRLAPPAAVAASAGQACEPTAEQRAELLRVRAALALRLRTGR